MTYLNIMDSIFRNNNALITSFSGTIFQLMEIYKFVLGQWRFLGDSTQEGESKKLYEHMQNPRFLEIAKKQIFGYRPSEEQFDKYDREELPPLEYYNIYRECRDNVTEDKFSFNKYQYYRFSACDLFEFKKHSSMDIMVTKNYDAVIYHIYFVDFEVSFWIIVYKSLLI